MTPRLYIFLAVLMSLVGIWVWGVMRPPPPGIAHVEKTPDIQTTPAVGTGDGGATYALTESEAIRYIRSTNSAAREELLRKCRWIRPTLPVESLTVSWDGDARIANAVVGVSPAPRTLHAVLVDSLEIPTNMLPGIEIAHDIALPGDWVIRRGTEPTDCLSYIGEMVRESGCPGFAFVREVRDQTMYIVRGEPYATVDVLTLFAPFPGVDGEVPLQSGTIDAFLKTLSRAIGLPIRIELSDHAPVEVKWCDNSPAYYQLGSGPTAAMVSNLLEKTAAHLHVTFERSEYEGVVWRLTRQANPE